MIPIILASLYNRATADDYAFSEFTRRAWVDTGSFFEVLKAAFQKVHDIYFLWQGTWFDIFLFAMQPEVFSDSAYWIGNLITMLLFISAFSVLMYHFMVKILGTDKSTFIFSTAAFLLLFYQFVPDKYSSIFWYNGCAHYMIPTAIAFIGVALVIDYSINYKTSTLIWISVIYTILGGVNYLSSIFSILLLLYIVFNTYYTIKAASTNSPKKIFLLFIPMTLEIIGLLISALAPGNFIREDIPISFELFITAIALSFKTGFLDMISRIKEYPYLLLIVIAFAIVVFIMLNRHNDSNGLIGLNSKAFQNPIIFTIVMYLVYTFMYWPEMFAQTSVSFGVYDMYFMMFYLMLFVCVIYWCGWITLRLQNRESISTENTDMEQSQSKTAKKHSHTTDIIILATVILLSAFTLLFFKGYVKESTDYRCYNFIASGRANQFKGKMDRQTQILEDPSITVITLPIIGDDVDPLFIMSISREPDAWANEALCRFYGKDIVYGVSEEEWVAMKQ